MFSYNAQIYRPVKHNLCSPFSFNEDMYFAHGCLSTCGHLKYLLSVFKKNNEMRMPFGNVGGVVFLIFLSVSRLSALPCRMYKELFS